MFETVAPVVVLLARSSTREAFLARATLNTSPPKYPALSAVILRTRLPQVRGFSQLDLRYERTSAILDIHAHRL